MGTTQRSILSVALWRTFSFVGVGESFSMLGRDMKLPGMSEARKLAESTESVMKYDKGRRVGKEGRHLVLNF